MTDNFETTENAKPVNPAKPSQLRLITLSLIILIAGIVIGSAGTTLIIQRKSGRPGGPIQGGAERMTHKLRERLDLSEDQFSKIKPIVKVHMDKLRDIQDFAHPLIVSEINEMKDEISELLTDEQKLLWERQITSLERKFARPRRGDSRGSRGGQGGRPRGPGRGDRPYDPGRNLRDEQSGGPDKQMRREAFRRDPRPPVYDQNSRE